MFIELAEHIRCPSDHEEMPCVVATDEMTGRRVVCGTVGCPVCEAQYPIVDGIVEFGTDPLLGVGSRSDDLTVEETPDVEAVQALLALTGSGGYVVLVGSAARLAGGISALIDGIHLVGINPPPEVGEAPYLSILRSPLAIPLKDSMARGAVLGREYVRRRWMDEGARVLVKGKRLIAVVDEPTAAGVEPLAVGDGMWVGEKRQ